MLLLLLLVVAVCCIMTSSFPLPPVFCSNKGEYSAHIRCDCSFNKIAITSVGLPRTSTPLFAHHVNKKITKRMMDRRPKKSRPSDINRNNQNHGKCITKMDLGPDYTLLPAAGRLAVFLHMHVGNCLAVSSSCRFRRTSPSKYAPILGRRFS